MAVLKSTIKTLMVYINQRMDSGESLSIEQTREAIENYETVQFLDQEFEEDYGIDLLIEGDHIDLDEVNQLIFQWADGTRGKLGIEKDGLNLLIGVLIEVLSDCDNLKENP